jgi:hypothetical protein
MNSLSTGGFQVEKTGVIYPKRDLVALPYWEETLFRRQHKEDSRGGEL